jgi:hypothetical protein
VRRRQLPPREALPAGGLPPLMVRPLPGSPPHLSGLRGAPVCHVGDHREPHAEEPEDGEPCVHDMPSLEKGLRSRSRWSGTRGKEGRRVIRAPGVEQVSSWAAPGSGSGRGAPAEPDARRRGGDWHGAFSSTGSFAVAASAMIGISDTWARKSPQCSDAGRGCQQRREAPLQMALPACAKCDVLRQGVMFSGRKLRFAGTCRTSFASCVRSNQHRSQVGRSMFSRAYS